MSKFKSESQRIGEEGEIIFTLFAHQKLNLTANKIVYDYGIDYLCQVGGKKFNNKQEMNSEFIGANVKSSSYPNPSATLTKEDMQFILKASFPVLMILVDINKNTVYYRFFDEDMLRTFHERLLSNKTSFTLKPKFMNENSDDFMKDLSLVTKKRYQSKLKHLKVQLNLQKLLGSIRLSIEQTEDEIFAIIEVENIEKIFDSTHKVFPLVREAFLAKSYNKGILIPEGSMKDFYIEDLNDIAERASLIAPVFYEEINIMLKRGSKYLANCNFERRQFGDESSFYHPSGLSFTLSKKRLGKDNHYYHYNEVLCIDKNTHCVFEYPDIIDLLSKCKSGDAFVISEGTGLPVEYWPRLINLGEILNKLERIYKKLDLEPIVKMSDLDSSKYTFSYYFIYNLLFEKNIKLLPNFIRQSIDNIDLNLESDIEWYNAEIYCPLIIHLPEGAVLVDVIYLGEVGFIDTNQVPLGLKFNKIKRIISCCVVNDAPYFEEPFLMIGEDLALVCKTDGFEQRECNYEKGITYNLIDD